MSGSGLSDLDSSSLYKNCSHLFEPIRIDAKFKQDYFKYIKIFVYKYILRKKNDIGADNLRKKVMTNAFQSLSFLSKCFFLYFSARVLSYTAPLFTIFCTPKINARSIKLTESTLGKGKPSKFMYIYISE